MKLPMYCGVPLGVLLAVASTAQGGISFTRISSNALENVAAQLNAEVSSLGGNLIQFEFTNAVGIASSITDVYWDDSGFLASLNSVTGSPGVSFSAGAAPPNLPGGQNAGFAADYSADSNAGPPGVSANGVNSASEYLRVVFALTGGVTFTDVLGALDSGLLRLGLHVQSIGAAGQSDSFVSSGPDGAVPAPGAGTLALLGVTGVCAIRRRLA